MLRNHKLEVAVSITPITKRIMLPTVSPHILPNNGKMPSGSSNATKVIIFWIVELDCRVDILAFSGVVSLLYTANWKRAKYTNPVVKNNMETMNNISTFPLNTAGSIRQKGMTVKMEER